LDVGLPSGAGALVGQRLGSYELLALLALGGTAEIYLARIVGTAGFEKYVVVKCLHDHLAEDHDFVSMFLDEARLGAALDHSNIVQTLGLGEHEGRYYIVMEFIAGVSLALVGRRAHERVRGGRLPVPIILNVAAQASAGLHHAHERVDGLVHRDVSPQNLVITYEGIVKLVDFGIAKAEVRETRTRSGTVKGKFAYMSPEQCHARNVDRRTDVFALGVIAWELLTGRRLFKHDATYDTYQAVMACRVPAPSSVNHELDPAVDEVVLGALHKDAAQRYPTAEAFGEAMMEYLHRRGKPSGPGEIARFFEECFAQEIVEHEARMRELIDGRKKSIADQKLLQWDASEIDGSASMLAPDDVDLIEGSSSDPAASPRELATAAALAASLGPLSPGMAVRASTVPARGSGVRAAETVLDDPIPAEDDFEARQKTDVEVWTPPRRDTTEADPPRAIAELDPRRATTAGEPRRVGTTEAEMRRRTTSPEKRMPTPPPRERLLAVARLRTGGAPLDPLPHELPIGTLPPPVVGPRFAEVPTVIAAAERPPIPDPQTGQTQMLSPEDLLEVAPSPVDAVAMPSPEAAFPDQPYYQHLAGGGELRKLPPWALAVMFVIVLAVATGITVALARALS